MKVLAVYQQAFTAITATTYSFEWTLPRVIKSKQSSKFLVKISNCQISTSATAPVFLFMSHPELTGRANTRESGATIISNKALLTTFYSASVANAKNEVVFMTNEMPLTPIILNTETTSGANPSTTVNFTVQMVIYEIDGDVDIAF
jgi:hypothetical protein